VAPGGLPDDVAVPHRRARRELVRGRCGERPTGGRLTAALARPPASCGCFAGCSAKGSWQARGSTTPTRATPRPPESGQRKSRSARSSCSAPANFPLASRWPAGTPASALAAGCPVVVKAHRGGTRAPASWSGGGAGAVRAAGLPRGCSPCSTGPGPGWVPAWSHPRIQVSGFTAPEVPGWPRRAAFRRPPPDPVYARMSSVNPVFLLPGALASRGRAGTPTPARSPSAPASSAPTPACVPAHGPELDAFLDSAAKAVEGNPGAADAHRADSRVVPRRGRPTGPTTPRSPSWPGVSSRTARPAVRPGWPPWTWRTSPATRPSSRRSSGPPRSWCGGRADSLIAAVGSLEGQLTPPCTAAEGATPLAGRCCRCCWPGGCCLDDGRPACRWATRWCRRAVPHLGLADHLGGPAWPSRVSSAGVLPGHAFPALLPEVLRDDVTGAPRRIDGTLVIDLTASRPTGIRVTPTRRTAMFALPRSG